MADAVAEAGFGSESRVYEKTGAVLGMTPGAARRGGEGELIRTAYADCLFGRLLIGATAKGICFLGFAEPDDALMSDLRRRFPRARSIRRRRLARQPRRGAGVPQGAETGPRAAAGPPGHRVPATRLAPVVSDPFGADPHLWRAGPDDGAAESGPRGGPFLCREPGFPGGAVPPGDRWRRRPDRLSLGFAEEAGSAGKGAYRDPTGGVNRAQRHPASHPVMVRLDRTIGLSRPVRASRKYHGE